MLPQSAKVGGHTLLPFFLDLQLEGDVAVSQRRVRAVDRFAVGEGRLHRLINAQKPGLELNYLDLLDHPNFLIASSPREEKLFLAEGRLVATDLGVVGKHFTDGGVSTNRSS